MSLCNCINKKVSVTRTVGLLEISVRNGPHDRPLDPYALIGCLISSLVSVRIDRSHGLHVRFKDIVHVISSFDRAAN